MFTLNFDVLNHVGSLIQLHIGLFLDDIRMQRFSKEDGCLLNSFTRRAKYLDVDNNKKKGTRVN